MTRGRRFSWSAAAAVTIGATAAVMFCQPQAAWAKPGAVTTKQGLTLVGDVNDAGPNFAVVDDNGSKKEINKANVASTVYFENNQQEFDARMRQLAPNDARGRVGVARWAVKQKETALATQALDAAQKIEPNNAEAAALRKQIAPTPPTTDGGSATTRPVRPTAAARPRLVTKEEMNHIRQVEWHPGDDAVRVNIDKQTKADFVAHSRDVTPAQFNRMSPAEQARVILKGGTDEMRAGVHIMTDPAPVLNYRRNVQKAVLAGCAAAGCHDATSKTGFSLYTEQTDEAAYTNYLILQNYRAKVGDRVRLMVDRDQPADSLLSEYMLPTRVANTPHPEVPGYVGAVRSAQDQRFKLLSQWINGMPTIAPNYGVDLSKPPGGGAAPPAGGAAPPAGGAAPAGAGRGAPAGGAPGSGGAGAGGTGVRGGTR